MLISQRTRRGDFGRANFFAWIAANTSIDKIKTLYAHPQVFTQCSHFLAELGNIEVKTMDSTSSAMLTVSELKRDDVATIGSEAGGNLYGLMAIKSNLANQKENHKPLYCCCSQPSSGSTSSSC